MGYQLRNDIFNQTDVDPTPAPKRRRFRRRRRLGITDIHTSLKDQGLLPDADLDRESDKELFIIDGVPTKVRKVGKNG